MRLFFFFTSEKSVSFLHFYGFPLLLNVRNGPQIMRIKSGTYRQISGILEVGLTYQRRRYFSSCKRLCQTMDGIQAGKKAAAIAAVDNHVHVSSTFSLECFNFSKFYLERYWTLVRDSCYKWIFMNKHIFFYYITSGFIVFFILKVK